MVGIYKFLEEEVQFIIFSIPEKTSDDRKKRVELDLLKIVVSLLVSSLCRVFSFLSSRYFEHLSFS